MNNAHTGKTAYFARRMLALLLAFLFAAALAPTARADEAATAKRLRLTVSGGYSAVKSKFLAEGADPLTDGSYRTEAHVYGTLSLSAPANIANLYISFSDTPTEFTVTAGDRRLRCVPQYLEVCVDVSALASSTLSLAFIGTVFALTYFFPLGEQDVHFAIASVFSGALFLGAFYMATDYTTSPCTAVGQIIYGVGCGALTVLIRYFGGYPEGVSFAILIMNMLVWYFDRMTKPRIFGAHAAGIGAKGDAKGGAAPAGKQPGAAADIKEKDGKGETDG